MGYRAEIKKHARMMLSQQFGTLLLAMFLAYLTLFASQLISPAASIIPFLWFASFLSPVIAIVLIPVYRVGIQSAALMVSRGLQTSSTHPFTAGFENYCRKLGGILWMQLFLALWSLLAIIPYIAIGVQLIGIIANPTAIVMYDIGLILGFVLLVFIFLIPMYIKYYTYYFTPYVLADCPNVNATDALKLSIRITRGRKWSIFVFSLSFIWWYLLIMITFGFAVIYVAPYIETAKATLYDSLKQDALVRGVITQDELNLLS